MEENRKKILLINAGSSSIKFQLVDYNNFNLLAQGICESIGLSISKFKMIYENQQVLKNIKFNDFKHAIDYIFDYLEKTKLIKNEHDIIAIGHRVVHDGSKTKGAEIINNEIMNLIKKYSKFAPLHNPFQLEVIEITQKMFPSTKQIACFDTGFHHSIDKSNYMYAIKKEIYEKYEIRKFGFHGLSYEYVNLKMQEILNKKQNNLIVCHLGSGCSMCCIKDSKSFNTSMGFSTYDGLIMCTRTGDISPGVMKYLSEELNLNNDEVSNIFLKESGLKGLCGFTDMRQVEENLDKLEDCKLAFELFIKRVVNFISIAMNDLELKIDGIVFTGGIGENSSLVRSEIIKRIKLQKLVIDEKINNDKFFQWAKISSATSQIPIYVVKTNEELIIAKKVKELIN